MFKKIYHLLEWKDKIQAYKLFFLMIIAALLDVVGVASILPFMGLLTNKSIVTESPIVSYIYNFFSYENVNDFTFDFGLFVCIFLFITMAVRSIQIYLQIKFSYMQEFSIGKKIFENFLHSNYENGLYVKSSHLSKLVLSETNTLVVNSIIPALSLVSNAIVVTMLMILILYINSTVALSIVIVFGFTVGIFIFLNKNFISTIGAKRLQANQGRFSTLDDATGAFKEIKLYSKEEYFLNNFSNFAKSFALYNSQEQTMRYVPRYFLEFIAFGGVIFYIIFLLKFDASFNEVLPTLTLFVFAGYKILPSLQQIYYSSSQLRFSSAALDAIGEALHSTKSLVGGNGNITFHSSLQIKNMNYYYPNSSYPALSNINLHIDYGDLVAVVGPSGSGKSTLVDSIMGLLTPSSGSILVDGDELTQTNIDSWQNCLSYVPQQPYFFNESIKFNVVFGEEKINSDKLLSACSEANLSSFIMSLPANYDFIVGEDAKFISGGQKQRLAIARALYKDPRMLVFDESTSALDGSSSYQIIKTLHNLKGKTTSLFITHNTQYLHYFDKVIYVNNGKVTFDGSVSDYFKFIGSNNV